VATRRDETKFSISRVEAFTDGVFAIAATLLVLDLTTAGFGQISSNNDLWAALAHMYPDFTAFVVSFLLLCMLWVIHFRQFRELAYADATLLWINNVRLLFVVLIPFTTSLQSEYSDFLAGRMLLPINVVLATLVGYFSWLWAASRDEHLLRKDAAHDVQHEGLGGLSAVITGIVSVALSPWFGPLAFLAYALSGPVEMLLRRARVGQPRARSAEAAPKDPTGE
jgi:uncharacterized membrane protein